MKQLIGVFGLALGMLFFTQVSRGQLAAPNEQGVSMGHVHLLVADVDASEKFWVEMGGTPFKFGQEKGLKFPGVLVLLRKGDPTGGSVGSVVDHIGFRVPDFDKAMAKWKPLGWKIEPGRLPKQAYIYTPDGLTKVEILTDPSQTVPITFHHVHFYVNPPSGGADPVAQIQAWYAKMFGAKPGMRAAFQADDLPGVNLTFTQSPTPTVGTKGRSIDHIGFEVANLEAFCKELEAKGVKLDRPYTKRPDLGLSIAFLTDPWGTSVELSEGLNHY